MSKKSQSVILLVKYASDLHPAHAAGFDVHSKPILNFSVQSSNLIHIPGDYLKFNKTYLLTFSLLV